MDEESKILERLTRVETKIDMMVNARDIAQEALQSCKAAHKRLDKIEANMTWMWRTVGGSIILALIGFALKGGLITP